MKLHTSGFGGTARTEIFHEDLLELHPGGDSFGRVELFSLAGEDALS